MRTIFVFGSNEAGKHGKGAALDALKNHGATYGQGEGIQGNSYGIPTKDHSLRTLPLSKIKSYVDKFIQFAKDHTHDMIFELTPVGTGLAKIPHSKMGPMFKGVSENVLVPDVWRPYVFGTGEQTSGRPQPSDSILRPEESNNPL